jgi:hypothetical protein
MIDPEERPHKAYVYPDGKPERDFRKNIIRSPKIRIVKLDGSGEKQYDYLPDLERSEGQKTWDLSVIQGYIVRHFDQVKWDDKGDDLVTA